MRPIDADALREQWLYGTVNDKVYEPNDVLDSIDDMPTIETVPHGDWNTENNMARCTVCGEMTVHYYDAERESEIYLLTKRCHECGAIMTLPADAVAPLFFFGKEQEF